MRIAGMVLARLVVLAAVGVATYVALSATARPYLVSGRNAFLPAAILLACIGGINAANPRRVLDQRARRTPRWELAVKQQLGPTLLQVFQACRQTSDGKACCTLDEAKTGLRIYLVGRPVSSGFARRLRLATSFDFSNPGPERWKTTEWIIGRTFTTGMQQGWQRSTDWPGLVGNAFAEADWEKLAGDKMDVTYPQALKLHDYGAIVAIPIKRNRRAVGVLALLINDECYGCIDPRILGTMTIVAASIGQLGADGNP
jgi:hypothetical protein